MYPPRTRGGIDTCYLRILWDMQGEEAMASSDRELFQGKAKCEERGGERGFVQAGMLEREHRAEDKPT